MKNNLIGLFRPTLNLSQEDVFVNNLILFRTEAENWIQRRKLDHRRKEKRVKNEK